MIKIKITQTYIEKTFTVKHKNKTYYIDYLNSDAPILSFNRDYWEAMDEEWEEIDNHKLKSKLIAFCIMHFNKFKPKDVNLN